MRFCEFVQLAESFDTISDFLLNPDHRNKTWQELMQEFEASGGKFIGSGRYGGVYEHPSWPYILKIFSDDSHYLKFVRFAYRNPHPSFPKFYGQPQRIIPFYKRSVNMAKLYIVRMEKLNEVTNRQMLKDILLIYDRGVAYFNALEKGYADQEYEQQVMPSFQDRRKGVQPTTIKRKRFQDVIDLFTKYPKAKSLYEAIYLVQKNIKESAMDIHAGNIMQRSNGDLVLTDPLWAGTNPYIDAQRAMDMETDSHPEEPPENLIGGKLPKRKRPKRYKPRNWPF